MTQFFLLYYLLPRYEQLLILKFKNQNKLKSCAEILNKISSIFTILNLFSFYNKYLNAYFLSKAMHEIC